MTENIGYTAKIRLVITGDDVSPDEISNELNVVPTVVSYKNKRRRPEMMPARQNVWSWYSSASEDQNKVDGQFSELIEKFSEKKEILKKISKLNQVTINVTIDAIDYYPGILFSSDIINFCYFSGANIEIDSYIGDYRHHK